MTSASKGMGAGIVRERVTHTRTPTLVHDTRSHRKAYFVMNFDILIAPYDAVKWL